MGKTNITCKNERIKKMVYAEIKIRILVDEDKLTAGQQIQANKANTDISQDHPLDAGINDLRNALDRFGGVAGLSFFNYLDAGCRAVKIEIE